MGAVRELLRRRRHTALLVSLVALFVARPLIETTSWSPLVFSLALLLVLLVSLYTLELDDLVGDEAALVAEHRRRRFVAWPLVALAAFERCFAAMGEPRHHFGALGMTTWLVFFAFVAITEMRNVLRHREVSGETIAMSVSIYLLLAVSWALAYALILVGHPGAFKFAEADVVDPAAALPVLLYFSLTTLSTTGFGDITPVSLQARYAAVAEGVAGQFYLAILVARLVSLQMSRVDRPRS